MMFIACFGARGWPPPPVSPSKRAPKEVFQVPRRLRRREFAGSLGCAPPERNAVPSMHDGEPSRLRRALEAFKKSPLNPLKLPFKHLEIELAAVFLNFLQLRMSSMHIAAPWSFRSLSFELPEKDNQ